MRSRKYNVVLITLKLEPKSDGSFTNKLTGDSLTVDDACTTIEQAQKSKKWREYIEGGIKAANAEVVSRAARVQKFAMLDTDFSVPGGELTSTLKLKRKPTSEKWADEIESLYK